MPPSRKSKAGRVQPPRRGKAGRRRGRRPTRAPLTFDILEGRSLLAAVTGFTLPGGNPQNQGIALGPDGNLWYAEYNANAIGRITPAGVVTVFQLPPGQTGPEDIVAGPGNDLWFTESGGNAIGRVTTAGVFSSSTIPTLTSQPDGIALGPDGNLWFAETRAGQIGRITPAGVITEFPIPGSNPQPEDITAGPDGALWFTMSDGPATSTVGRITTAGAFTTYTLPSPKSQPAGITAGPDGALWIADSGLGTIDRLTTAGAYSQFAIPVGTSTTANPQDITAGPDGALWFTDKGENTVDQITTAGTVTVNALPSGTSNPRGITPGPDGALWFTGDGSIGVARVTTAGVVTAFNTSGGGGGNATNGIAVGPDGNLWFTASGAGAIGRVSTAGTLQLYALPSNNDGQPEGITAGPDGNLWFTLSGGGPASGAIGRITTAGVITEYPTPTPNSDPTEIAAGSDGALWFTETSAGKIGRISTAGVITEYTVPGNNPQPQDITAGPDGALWFTVNGGPNGEFIGRITTAGVITEFALSGQSQPQDIVTGPDGALWFVDDGLKTIDRITTAGAITEYPIAAGTDHPNGIGAGPDGDLWFTTTGGEVGNSVNSITTAGVVTNYPLPSSSPQPGTVVEGPDGALWITETNQTGVTRFTADESSTDTPTPVGVSHPQSVVTGPDGALWFTSSNGGAIGRVTTAGGFSTYTLPGNRATPYDIVAGPDGNLWFTDNGDGDVGMITTAGVVTEYPLSANNAQPEGITVGPDGALWFTETGANKIGRITTAGVLTEYTVPTQNANPTAIVVGPDGTLWFIEANARAIGRITTAGTFLASISVGNNISPEAEAVGSDGNLWITDGNREIDRVTPGGVVTVFPLSNSFNSPTAITAGPDGALWFADGSAQVGQITTAGVVSSFATAVSNGGTQGITVGPDGALWFTDPKAGQNGAVGRVTTAGASVEYMIPQGQTAPQGITAGSDGALWYAETNANAIGRTTTAGVTMEYSVPTPQSAPYDIVAGPDGALWFTENKGNKIGRITTAGVFTEYTIPTNNAQPEGITLGPDGALWFAENGGKAIGRITTAGVITEYPLPQGSANPAVITVGPDGALWFASNGGGANSIGRITTAGALSFFKLPSGSGNITGITSGADGAIWFNEGNSTIGRLTTTGLVTTYPLPSTGPNSAQGITAGPDGNLYMAVNASDFYGIESVSTSGVVTQLAIPSANVAPWGITVGPDNAIWYTENKGDRVGTLGVFIGAAPAPIAATGQAIAAIAGTTFSGAVATFSDPHAGGIVGDFAATITWGDGASSAGTVSFNAATGLFTVSGSHTYTAAGSDAVSVTVADFSGDTATATGTATVAPAPTTLVVTTASDVDDGNTSSIAALLADPGAGGLISLREAILAVDNTPSTGTPVVIDFDIPGAGPFVIDPTSPLPVIGNPVLIDGTSQPGYNGTPVVVLNGRQAGAGVNGLTITAGHTTVRGLVIDGFGGDGIFATAQGGDVITGDYIGTDVTGTTAVPNGVGIVVDASGNTIGGTDPGAASTIAYNAGKGVVVAGGTGNAIEGNAIFANAGLGIDLGNDGVTPNTGAENAALPNSGMNTPVFTTAIVNGNTLTIAGYIGTAPGESVFAGSRVEVFQSDNDPSGHGQGETFLGFLTADAGGDFSGVLSVSGLNVGDTLTATATDTAGDTSEFAADFTTQSAAVSTTAVVSSANPSVYGQSVTFTATVSGALGTPTGTVTFLEGSTVLATDPLSGGTFAFTIAALPAGNLSITARYNGNGLYAASTSPALIQTVTPASLTVTADSPSKVYGTTLPPLTYTFAGLVNGDTPSVFSGALTTSATSASGVGGYTIDQGTLTADGNYTLTFVTGTLTVTPAPLTVTADNLDKALGAPVPPLTYTANGLVNGDTPTVFTGGLTTTATAASGNGDYPIVQGTLSAGPNYTLTFNPGILTIAFSSTTALRADVNASVYGRSVTFTATVSGFSGTPTGSVTFLDGSTVLGTAPLSGGVATFPTPALPAGADDITAQYDGDAQYVPSTSTVLTESVTPAPLTVTADSPSKVYGAQLPALTYTESGLVNGDSTSVFSGALATSATAASGVGTYAIGQGNLSAGPDYTIRYVAGAVTVTPAPLTVTANNAARYFDQSNPAFSADYVGLVNGDTPGALDGSLSFSIPAGLASPVGTYPLIPGGLSAVDYTITFVDGTLTVEPLALAATGATVNAEEGVAFSGPVATFAAPDSTPNPGNYAATIRWGDGQVSAGTVAFDTARGVYTVDGVNTYQAEGVYAVQVTVAVGAVAVATADGIATVTGAPLTVAGAVVAPTAGKAYAGAVATFRDGNPSSRPSDFTVTIDWGDGATSPGTVVANGRGGFVALGTHTYTTAGSFTAEITVDDRNGSRSSAEFDARVVAPPTAPVVVTPAAPTPEPTATRVATVGGSSSIGVVALGVPATTLPATSFGVSGPSGPAAGTSFPGLGGPRGAPSPGVRGSIGAASATVSSGSGSGSSAATAAATGATASAGAAGAANGGGGGGAPANGVLQAAFEAAVAAVARQIAALLGTQPTAGATPTIRGEAIPGRDAVDVRTVANRVATTSNYLRGQLDEFDKQVSSGLMQRQVARAFGTGAIAYVGYVLLNGRAGYVLLSLLTARPLWAQVDPLAVLIDWERDQKRKTGDRDDEETLQSLIERGRGRQQDEEGDRDDAPEPGAHELDRQSPVRRPRRRALARQRGRRSQGAKGSL